jgi:crotonobetainyl-CoA:carnitine CoA-transferase CaiB-like acyl-CoA transferase
MHPDTIDINIDLPGGRMPASHEAGSGGPLDGIRVLDLSSVVMGPLATQILGDLGADVITVETRDGDINRIMGSGPYPGLSGVSLNLLRNKRNISLDVAHPDGRAALLRVAAGCDVFVTNLRPGSVGRLRLRYPDIASIRPDVIYCQAHGFPSDSPQADAPAFDDIIQAACGVPDVLRRASGRPGLMPTLLADKVSGLVLAYSIIAALFHRARTGEDQKVAVPMADAMLAFLLVEHGSGAISRPARARPGTSASSPRCAGLCGPRTAGSRGARHEDHRAMAGALRGRRDSGRCSARAGRSRPDRRADNPAGRGRRSYRRSGWSRKASTCWLNTSGWSTLQTWPASGITACAARGSLAAMYSAAPR